MAVQSAGNQRTINILIYQELFMSWQETCNT